MLEAKNPLNVETLNFDDADERMAFYRALNELGRDKVAEGLRDLWQRGIIDANGNRISTEIPPDMLNPDSTVEQL